MTERLRSGNNFINSANISTKMSNDLTPRKTMLILVIVVGCFAVLWPKVFYPMLVGSANQHIKPSPIDRTTGCCDVISEVDVHTIKIMSELCKTIIKNDTDGTLTGRDIVAKCQNAVLETCGIDISAVLQEQVRLGQSIKQILDEIRSLNGSLCLKYNFGVAPWRLGVPHRVTVKPTTTSIRQERPPHLRSELVHPAFRERGRAIPQPQATNTRSTTRVVEGRPGPIPGLRPTLGGPGHVVPPPKQGTGSMGLIMPIYTIGIVIFFTYTVMKIIFKKQPETLYPPVEPDPNFRREVFESERRHAVPKLTREGVSSKLGDAELDQLRQRLRETELAMERIVEQMAKVPLKLQNVVANGNLPQEEEQPSVRVLGMEMTASCEGGKKWSRPNSPVFQAVPAPIQEPAEPPQEIYLEGALPAQSHLLVADSATEAEKTSSEEDPAVVLAGKMTLSVISLDSSENGSDESSNVVKRQEERSSSNVSDEFEKIEVDEQISNVEETVSDDSVQQLDTQLLGDIQNEAREINSAIVLTKSERDFHLPQVENVEPDINTQNDHQTESTLDESSASNKVDESAVIDNVQDTTVSKIDESASVDKIESIIDKDDKTVEELHNADITTEDLVDIVDELNVSDAIKDAVEQEIDINKTNDEIKSATQDVLVPTSQPDTITEEVSPIQNVNINKDTPKEEIKEIVTETCHLNDVLESPVPELRQSTFTPQHSVSSSPPEAFKSVSGLLLAEPTQSSEILSSIEKKPSSLNNSEEKIAESHQEKVEEVEIKAIDTNLQLQEEIKSKIEESQDKVAQSKEPLTSTSTSEKESFEKLNEAISDLSSELRDEIESENIEDVEEDYVNDEEIEYEYEDSDNEEVPNVDRLEDELVVVGTSGAVNGDNQEHSKYGTSSATLAENDISDEEVLENEDGDEDIQEIIEYITDEEEQVEYIIPPAQTNNSNHLSDQTRSQ